MHEADEQVEGLTPQVAEAAVADEVLPALVAQPQQQTLLALVRTTLLHLPSTRTLTYNPTITSC